MRKLERYTGVAMALHWAIAALILFNVLLVQIDDLPQLASIKRAIIDLHKSNGLAVLVLMLARVVWRITHVPPALPETYKSWEVKASHAAHIGR